MRYYGFSFDATLGVSRLQLGSDVFTRAEHWALIGMSLSLPAHQVLVDLPTLVLLGPFQLDLANLVVGMLTIGIGYCTFSIYDKRKLCMLRLNLLMLGAAHLVKVD